MLLLFKLELYLLILIILILNNDSDSVWCLATQLLVNVLRIAFVLV